MTENHQFDADARIVSIRMDDQDQPRLPDEVAHERSIAIYDLIEENRFAILAAQGPYALLLRSDSRHIGFDIRTPQETPVMAFVLAMGPFRRIIRDYRMVCDNYYEAIRTMPPSQIQAIDMGRRALHNEGSTLLQERLAGKAVMDFDTARRLFSLICVLRIGKRG